MTKQIKHIRKSNNGKVFAAGKRKYKTCDFCENERKHTVKAEEGWMFVCDEHYKKLKKQDRKKKMVSIRYAPDSIQTGFHLVPADEVCPRCGGHIDGQEGCSTCGYGYQP